jgi:hypothetical protein
MECPSGSEILVRSKASLVPSPDNCDMANYQLKAANFFLPEQLRCIQNEQCSVHTHMVQVLSKRIAFIALHGLCSIYRYLADSDAVTLHLEQGKWKVVASFGCSCSSSSAHIHASFGNVKQEGNLVLNQLKENRGQYLSKVPLCHTTFHYPMSLLRQEVWAPWISSG